MKTIRVEVICVGSELLSHRVNTHTAALGRMLGGLGLTISRSHDVGDDAALMKEVFSEAFRRSRLVLCAGGLGPTFDDITRTVWSNVLHRPLRFQPDLVADIRRKFAARGLAMPPHNRRQGYLLKGADVLPNFFGTAPGQFLSRNGKVLVLLPGPAREMIPMMERFVLPRLERAFTTEILRNKSFHMIGIPESVVDHRIRPLIRARRVGGCRVEYGILASSSVITVKIRVSGGTAAGVEAVLSRLSAKFRKKLGSLFFGEDDETLGSVIGKALKKKNKTLSIAESCTGGLISKMITDVPGSSDYFREGVITYSNKSKVDRLGVKRSSLARWGAVSSRVAKEMVSGIKRRTGSDCALSVTGVAGPGGGSPEKPVGLVYIGCSTPNGTVVKEWRFTGDREWIRHRAAMMALNMLRRSL